MERLKKIVLNKRVQKHCFFLFLLSEISLNASSNDSFSAKQEAALIIPSCTKFIEEQKESSPKNKDSLDTKKNYYLKKVEPCLKDSRFSNYATSFFKNFLSSSSAEELFELKKFLSLRPYDKEITSLIFHKFKRKNHQQNLLEHLKDQNKNLKKEKIIILSDLDDTLWQGPFDKKAKFGELYSCASLLLKDADLKAFITARPQILRTLTRNAIQNRLDEFFSLHTAPIFASIWGFFNKKTLAIWKASIIRMYVNIFPEAHILWLGDSSQGDALSGLVLLNEKQNSNLAQVLIHDLDNLSTQEKKQYQHEKIFFYQNYLEMINLLGVRNILPLARHKNLQEACLKETSRNLKGVRDVKVS